ncbi:uncharacterized protein LOC122305807 [Carya illinoinensis]|uniref:uncharacterized protein LOC122305807 n=1 Tax=Carya illinoinensis TaxID=32201 RepID=UPI001C71E494|nr:uncharacterized protein LOC122305807 [Carya illinoinensis]
MSGLCPQRVDNNFKWQNEQQCKIHDSTLGLGTTRLIEPKYVELLSALAAGNRAKLMVEITSNDISPLTLALAVAAKQTGGRLVCIIHEDHDDIEKSKARLAENDLEDTIDFVHGNPCEVISRYKNIDFAVIDCKLEDHIKLFKTINLNPSGSIVAVSNLQHRRDGISFAEVVKGRNIGVKSVTLPIGEGMELTRIRSTGKPETWRSYKKFHVIFEN